MRRWFSAGALLVSIAASCSSSDEETKQTQPKGDAGIDGAAGSSNDATVGCTTHLECSLFDEPARCVAGQCVEMRTTECPCVPNLPGAVWKEDDSILIGAFAPLLPTGDPCDDPASINYRLALQEFNDVSVGGIPPGKNIAVVICNNQAFSEAPESEKSAAVDKASKHLVETLHVPGILAAVTQPDLVTMTQNYAKPNGVFLLTPFGATNATATLVDDGLLWHMLGTPDQLATTYAALVTAMELVVPTLLNQPGPLRVLVVGSTDEFSEELTPALEATVTFNGKSWAQNVADGNLFVGTATDQASAQAVAVQLLQMDPHIVISTTGEFALPVWEIADSGGVRPFFILSPLDFGEQEAWTASIESAKSVTTLPDLEQQFVFVNPAGTEDVDLLDGYKSRLSAFSVGAPSYVENAYDAAYYLIYSLLKAGDPPRGAQMAADGMPALIAASPDYNVGPDDIIDVFGTLTAGQVRLNGLMGPPTFATNGVRAMTGELDCFMELTPFNLALRNHVGHFDADTQKLRKAKVYAGGAVPCLDWLNLPDN